MCLKGVLSKLMMGCLTWNLLGRVKDWRADLVIQAMTHMAVIPPTRTPDPRCKPLAAAQWHGLHRGQGGRTRQLDLRDRRVSILPLPAGVL